MKLWASEISSRLAENIESVLADLLPGGKRHGNLYRAGNTTGEAGESLAVNLTGARKGRWTDYATGEGGDLLDLWAASKGLGIAEAIEDAGKYLGIDTSQPERPKRQPYAEPKAALESLSLTHQTWLKTARWMDMAVVERFKLKSKGNAIAFQFFDPTGNLFLIKYREAKPRKEAKLWAEKDCRRGLFGWQALDPKARTVAITEGELDAIALTQYGMPALSVPDGANSHGWVEHEYDNLARFDTIYLALDTDEPGQKATAELIERLGRERCRVVRLPRKDANDCLIEGVTTDELRQAFKDSKALDPDELRKPSEYRRDIHELFNGTPDRDVGFGPPWPAIRDHLRFRPGELVIVAGPNGTGKSQLMGHFSLEAMRDGLGVCIASMEFKPQGYLKRLLRQATAQRELTNQYIDHALNWLDELLWVFAATGTAKVDTMLSVFEYARRRYGITVFVVDNLAKCGFAEDDYNGQKAFVDRLTDFARDFQTTVFLVHHMRKGGEGKDGIKGTGAITDMADTVLTIWRAKDKQDEIAKLQAEAAKAGSVAHIPQDLLDEPDGGVSCVKQRNGESEPSKAIWFHADSFQFLSGPQAKPFRYCPDFQAKAVDTGWAA